MAFTYCFILVYQSIREPYITSNKHFRKNCFNIRTNLLYLKKDENYVFSYKGKSFKFKLEMSKGPETGLRYKLPVYAYYDIYLNDMIVCRIHRLENGYLTYNYYCDYSKDIIADEVKEIIRAMNKSLNKEYRKKYFKYSSYESEKSLLK